MSETTLSRNCWEVLNCGREPGGDRAGDQDICPAALEQTFNGVNGGRAGGRFCWAVAETLCTGRPSGSYAEKIRHCLRCGFLQQVEKETPGFILAPQHAICQLNL